MEKRRIGGSDIEVGVIGLGTMNFGSDWHGIGRVSDQTARRLVDMALAAGVNFIDCADIYGRGAAEKVLGKILKGRRSKFVVSTKVLGRMREDDPASGGLSARHITEGLDASLKRLRTDYVDLYMPHAPDPEVPIEESLEAFAGALKAGKVRVLGCSNFQRSDWRRCLDWAKAAGAPRFEFNQIQYSLAAPYAKKELEALCRRDGVGVLSWSPLGGGFLSGKYSKNKGKSGNGRRKDSIKAFPALPERRLSPVLKLLQKVSNLEGVSMTQAALGWVISKPWISSAIVGARTPAQLEETLAARPLSTKAESLLDRAAEKI